jgi:hypothetical protein
MSECERVRSGLSRSLYEDSEGFPTVEEREHLARCAACREDWQRFQDLLGGLARVEVPDPGESYWQGFLPRLRGRIAAAAAPVPKRNRWLPAPALAAAASFAMAALALWNWGPSEITRAQIRLGEMTRSGEADRIQDEFEVLLPDPDSSASFPSGGEWIPRASELNEALDEVLPEDDAELFGETGRLPTASREWLSEVLDPDWV